MHLGFRRAKTAAEGENNGECLESRDTVEAGRLQIFLSRLVLSGGGGIDASLDFLRSR